jgi:FLVCR family MFS transporter 7
VALTFQFQTSTMLIAVSNVRALSGTAAWHNLRVICQPFGGAIAQLMAPAIVDNPSHVRRLLLIVAILTSVLAPCCFLVGSRPPTPPSYIASQPRQSAFNGMKELFTGSRTSTRGKRDFCIIVIAFSLLVSAFDAFSTVLNEIFGPVGYSDDESGKDIV